MKLKKGKCRYINSDKGFFKLNAKIITSKVPKKDTELFITPRLKPYSAPNNRKITIITSTVLTIIHILIIKYIIINLKNKVKHAKICIVLKGVLMNNNKYIVFKISDNLKEKFINYYLKYPARKTPPYAVFQVINYDTIITLYESGKVMFQGLSADIEASIWIEQEKIVNKRIISLDKKEKKKESPKVFYDTDTIGSDEVGTGDYFGPIVVTATFVAKDKIPYLKTLGVRDSKKITDSKIKEIAKELIKNIPYVTYILDNSAYNNLPEEDRNLNKIKAILHNKVLTTLIKKDNYPYKKIIIDQFVYPKKFYEYIKDSKEQIKNVTFITKAEDQALSVGAAAIISRYIFLKEIKKMSQKLGMDIPLGAGIEVDKTARILKDKIGLENLKKYVKFDYKNTLKLTDVQDK